MKQFSGFPAKTQFTPIPNVFFSSLLPQISDIAELKTTLHIFWSLYGKRGYPRFTTYRELSTNRTLMSSLSESGKSADEVLGHALEMAARGYQVTGIDVSEDMLSEAARKARDRGLQIEFARQNATELSAPDKFDAAYILFNNKFF